MPVEKDREQWKKILRGKGLKVTRQRLLVLEVLSASPGRHLTAEEIYESGKADYPEIGLATVYRTVQLLSELHLINRLNLDDGFVRYEIGDICAGTPKHRHHHMICLQCGKVLSFEDDLLEELEKKIQDKTGFAVTDHEVKLYGSCRECGGKTD